MDDLYPILTGLFAVHLAFFMFKYWRTRQLRFIRLAMVFVLLIISSGMYAAHYIPILELGFITISINDILRIGALIFGVWTLYKIIAGRHKEAKKAREALK